MTEKGSRLVADVGGTHIRLALLEGDQPTLLRSERCADYPSLEEAIRSYLRDSPPGVRVRKTAIAVACPILGDRVEMTNRDWAFSQSHLRSALDLDRLEVVNDFAALALALPVLGETDTTVIKPGSGAEGEPLALLGPGTGLGVAGLIPCEPHWKPLSTEGGHRDLAPHTDREWEIFKLLRHQFGHVSVERVLSGPGLVQLFSVINRLEGKTVESVAPEEVVARASRDDRVGVEAVEQFSAWLGAVAGDLALTLGALGGVYLGGGILPKMGVAFVRARFEERFLDKGRFRHYLEPIPVRLIVEPTAALRGLARLLQDPRRPRRRAPKSLGPAPASDQECGR
jgi:glucokinase